MPVILPSTPESSSVAEFLADLKVGVDELKTVTPQIPEEQHAVFLLKKQVVDTLVERVEIDRERNLDVKIRLNLLDILRKDARNGITAKVQILMAKFVPIYQIYIPQDRSLWRYKAFRILAD